MQIFVSNAYLYGKKLLNLQKDNVLWKNMSRIIAFCDIGTENNILRT